MKFRSEGEFCASSCEPSCRLLEAPACCQDGGFEALVDYYTTAMKYEKRKKKNLKKRNMKQRIEIVLIQFEISKKGTVYTTVYLLV